MLCPFLKERVPAEVWQRYRTIVIHPVRPGDRGPSSLDWAIRRASRLGGHRAAGGRGDGRGPDLGVPDLPARPPTRRARAPSTTAPVTDAAMALVHEVVAKAADPAFAPRAAGLHARPDVVAGCGPRCARPTASSPGPTRPSTILRRIRAADGVARRAHHALRACRSSVFDAHPGPAPVAGQPGTVAARRHGAVLVRTGDGAVWIGSCVQRAGPRASRSCRPPLVLADRLGEVPEVAEPRRLPGDRLPPRRAGRRARLRFYNGAMSTGQCRGWRGPAARGRPGHPGAGAARRRAVLQRHPPQRHRGGAGPGSGGVGTTSSPSTTCAAEIITCTDQLVVSAVGGNAGAGGVMLALGADQVLVPRRGGAQPALPDDGPVRLGVLDLRAAPPGRQHTRPSG